MVFNHLLVNGRTLHGGAVELLEFGYHTIVTQAKKCRKVSVLCKLVIIGQK
jgi:hypothetical protein